MAVLATSACGDSDNLSPNAPDAVEVNQVSTFTVEPAVLTPEFLRIPVCSGRPAFRLGFALMVGANTDLTLRRLSFGFTDRFGLGAVPFVFPATPTTANVPAWTPTPVPGPIPIPTSSPVTTPSSSAVNIEALIAAGSPRSLPFFAQFGCGVATGGTLTVTAETEQRGRRGRARLTVPIRD